MQEQFNSNFNKRKPSYNESPFISDKNKKRYEIEIEKFNTLDEIDDQQMNQSNSPKTTQRSPTANKGNTVSKIKMFFSKSPRSNQKILNQQKMLEEQINKKKQELVKQQQQMLKQQQEQLLYLQQQQEQQEKMHQLHLKQQYMQFCGQDTITSEHDTFMRKNQLILKEMQNEMVHPERTSQPKRVSNLLFQQDQFLQNEGKDQESIFMKYERDFEWQQNKAGNIQIEPMEFNTQLIEDKDKEMLRQPKTDRGNSKTKMFFQFFKKKSPNRDKSINHKSPKNVKMKSQRNDDNSDNFKNEVMNKEITNREVIKNSNKSPEQKNDESARPPKTPRSNLQKQNYDVDQIDESSSTSKKIFERNQQYYNKQIRLYKEIDTFQSTEDWYIDENYKQHQNKGFFGKKQKNQLQKEIKQKTQTKIMNSEPIFIIQKRPPVIVRTLEKLEETREVPHLSHKKDRLKRIEDLGSVSSLSDYYISMHSINLGSSVVRNSMFVEDETQDLRMLEQKIREKERIERDNYIQQYQQDQKQWKENAILHDQQLNAYHIEWLQNNKHAKILDESLSETSSISDFECKQQTNKRQLWQDSIKTDKSLSGSNHSKKEDKNSINQINSNQLVRESKQTKSNQTKSKAEREKVIDTQKELPQQIHQQPKKDVLIGGKQVPSKQIKDKNVKVQKDKQFKVQNVQSARTTNENPVKLANTIHDKHKREGSYDVSQSPINNVGNTQNKKGGTVFTFGGYHQDIHKVHRQQPSSQASPRDGQTTSTRYSPRTRELNLTSNTSRTQQDQISRKENSEGSFNHEAWQIHQTSSMQKYQSNQKPQEKYTVFCQRPGESDQIEKYEARHLGTQPQKSLSPRENVQKFKETKNTRPKLNTARADLISNQAANTSNRNTPNANKSYLKAFKKLQDKR